MIYGIIISQIMRQLRIMERLEVHRQDLKASLSEKDGSEVEDRTTAE